jgi:hypothetical protein
MSSRIGAVAAVMLVGLLAGLTAPADALPRIDLDFSTGGAGPGGTIVISSGGVVGTGILLDMLTYTSEYESPSSRVFDLSGRGTGLSGSTAILNFQVGTAGNYLEVIGGVPELGVPDGTVLLSGYFTYYDYRAGNGFGAFWGTGRDEKSDALLRALGLPPDLSFDFFGFTIGLQQGADGRYVAVSTDIVNRVPGPSMLVGLGAGLLALAIVARRLRSE